MNIFRDRNYNEFDSYEKTVFDWDSSSFEWSKKKGYTSEEDVYSFVEERLKNNKCFEFVHYKDIWDIAVLTSIEMAQLEYSGNLCIYPPSMFNQYIQSVNKMCCGIVQYRHKCVSGREYLIAFDYGH